MKKITTEIKNKGGNVRTISVYVDDKTAADLECCDEEIRRFYILEEYKEFNRTRSETRRHFSFEELTDELGNEPCSHDETLDDWYDHQHEYERLCKAMSYLSDKQFHALWLVAVDELSIRQAAKEMGLPWETVRYLTLRKYFIASVKFRAL